jgi:hypothetical protein
MTQGDFRRIAKKLKTAEIFNCEICNFTSSHKNHFLRHLKTNKHKLAILALLSLQKRAKGDSEGPNGPNAEKVPENVKKFECHFCARLFKSKGGKYKHIKKCSNYPTNLKKQLKEERTKNKKLVNIIDTRELEHLREKVAILEKHKIIQNIETQNNNIQNINIQLFLNENCANAIPIMDFIKNLKFKLTDIDPNRPNSTIESLTNIVVTELNQLDNTERPIHCSDAKRHHFYVKDASGWAKDIDNKKIDKAMGWANMRHQGAWHEYAKEKGLDSQKKDVNYHKMNVAMAAWSDDPAKAKKKVKRAIAGATNLKNAKLGV